MFRVGTSLIGTKGYGSGSGTGKPVAGESRDEIGGAGCRRYALALESEGMVPVTGRDAIGSEPPNTP